MKNLKIKKLVAVALVAMTIATVSPVGASAEWKQDSNGWWNTEANSYSTGWRAINGSWYCFGSDGYMKTGWVNDGGKWYFTAPSGEMKTGWVNDRGTWYFTAASGEMKTGWVSDGGKWYFTSPSGAMQTGWVNDRGTWYFTAASGAMATGVVEVDGKVYCLASNGAMATGAVTIDGVTYNFAASGEAIGDKIPTPTVEFTSAGTVVTPSEKTDEMAPKIPTTSTTGRSSGGGGSHGISYTDITPLVSNIYSTKFASSLQNHPTLANKISVNAGDSIVVTLKDSRLESLQTVFDAVQNEELSLIEARLSKAEKIMNSYSKMLNVDGVSFEQYLAKAEKKYVLSGGNSTYFKADGSFNTTEIAKRIKNNTLSYDDFKKALKDRVIAMCDETKTAPQVKISYSDISQTVTKIQRDGITIYDTGLSIDTNINGLFSLGDTTPGTYTIYCGSNYFTVKVVKS